MSSTCLAIFDVGFGEVVMIFVIALLLFGGDLPQATRKVGRVVGDLKRAADNLTREFRYDMHRENRPTLKPRRPEAMDNIFPRETPATPKESVPAESAEDDAHAEDSSGEADPSIGDSEVAEAGEEPGGKKPGGEDQPS